jgi:replicative DNA helicase
MTPPQDHGLEKTLLGLCLESQDNYDRMAQVLQGDASMVFYFPFHQSSMTALQSLMRQGQAVDLAGMRIELTKLKAWTYSSEDDIVGFYEAAIANRGYSQGIEGIAMHLAQLHAKRSSITLCEQVMRQAYDPSTDGFEVLQNLALASSRIDGPLMNHNIKHVSELTGPLLKKLEEAQAVISSGTREIIGQTSGLELLDDVTGGDMPGDLVIVGARPGGSKSVFALEEAKAGAMAGDPQAILSLEMDDDMQVGRLLADMGGVQNNKIQQAKANAKEWEAMHRAAEDVSKLPLYLEFCPGLTILQLEPRIRWLVRTKGVKRIFIDYLQLMCTETSTKHELHNENIRIGAITKRLKFLAGNLGISIVLLSQMSREIEKRAGEKIPMLSDLRDSGNIEQDAVKVYFLYSPFEFEKSVPKYCAKFYPLMDYHELKRLTFIVVAKQRNGVTGMYPVWNDRQFCRISTIRDHSVYQRLRMVEQVSEELQAKWGWQGQQGVLFDENEIVSNESSSNGSKDMFPF